MLVDNSVRPNTHINRCQSESCIPVNIVSHVHYSLVNNVPPQGILYPHSHQWMLYPIQYSLVNTAPHTIFTSEYCTPFSRAYQDAHKYVLTSTCTKLYYKLYYFAVATVPLIFLNFFSKLVLVWACILHCTILRIQCKKPSSLLCSVSSNLISSSLGFVAASSISHRP